MYNIRFAMVSNAIFFLTILLSVQCRIVPSVDNEISSIPLSELLSTFQSTDDDFVTFHLMFMLFTASYGDRIYNLPVDLSTECGRTARAITLMLEKLAIGREQLKVVGEAIENSTRDLKEHTELTEHPLEPFCRQIEQRFANSNSSNLLEKAKQDAGFTNVISPRPAYFEKLLDKDNWVLKMEDKADVPELLRVLTVVIFRDVVDGDQSVPKVFTLFAKSCQAVAKKERFADSMQSIFEKTIDDILPEILIREKTEKSKSNRGDPDSNQTPGSWWIPNFSRIMYGYIAQDSTLKKEVDDMAPTVDQFGKKYWDLSNQSIF